MFVFEIKFAKSITKKKKTKKEDFCTVTRKSESVSNPATLVLQNLREGRKRSGRCQGISWFQRTLPATFSDYVYLRKRIDTS